MTDEPMPFCGQCRCLIGEDGHRMANVQVVTPIDRITCLDCRRDLSMLNALELINPDYRPEFIILHHSATKDSGTVSWDAIRRWHIEVNGWSDIGYHFGTELVGTEYMIKVGRPLARPGAHVKQGLFNKRSIGVCVVGDYDRGRVPVQQWILTRFLVEALQRVAKIRPVNVIGHREAQAMAGVPPENRKTCPGLNFDLDAFRAELREV